LNSDKIWKLWRKCMLNSEKVGKYGISGSWIVKIFIKYKRKLWKDMKLMKERWVED
jgi:hypothetical protein